MYQLFSTTKIHSLPSLLVVVSFWSFDSINSTLISVNVAMLNNNSRIEAKKAKTAGNRIVTIEWTNHIPTPGTGTLPPETKLESHYRERNE